MKFSDVMIFYNYKKTNVARALKVSRQLIGVWQKKNIIPWHWQCELQVITNGELLADKREDENEK